MIMHDGGYFIKLAVLNRENARLNSELEHVTEALASFRMEAYRNQIQVFDDMEAMHLRFKEDMEAMFFAYGHPLRVEIVQALNEEI